MGLTSYDTDAWMTSHSEASSLLPNEYFVMSSRFMACSINKRKQVLEEKHMKPLEAPKLIGPILTSMHRDIGKFCLKQSRILFSPLLWSFFRHKFLSCIVFFFLILHRECSQCTFNSCPTTHHLAPESVHQATVTPRYFDSVGLMKPKSDQSPIFQRNSGERGDHRIPNSSWRFIALRQTWAFSQI